MNKYRNAALPLEVRVADLLSQLTLKEKVSLLHADTKFSIPGIPRLGIPPLTMSDGPQGVREEVKPDSWEPAGRNDDFATALPSGIGLAATWNPALLERCAKMLAEECRARGKQMLLAPGINIMRTPLCGRNYDYYGEDPFLSAQLAAAYVRGLQSEGVAACVKHFAANNQEQDRLSINVEMDERTLREIYLPAFESAVLNGGAWAVMGAYNKFRGEYCCQNAYLLNEILKREWGFDGTVISDWGGVHDTRGAVENGLDIEMGTDAPFDEYYMATPFLKGLEEGCYSKELLDEKVRRVLRLYFRCGLIDTLQLGSINTKAHRDIAFEAAREAVVLLKNQGSILPLNPEKVSTLAVIGDNAIRRFCNIGNSAGVKAFHETCILEGIIDRVGKGCNILFSRGYAQAEVKRGESWDVTGVSLAVDTEVSTDKNTVDPGRLAAQAVEAAKMADHVIFVAGLNHFSGGDDEGADKCDLDLPSGQAELIRKIAAVNPNLAVVLVAGSPVLMDAWIDEVPAVMLAWYGGSEGGHALASVLFGDVDPSGRLPCTFPRMLKDSPPHVQGDMEMYPGLNGTLRYKEGIWVGYRYFNKRGVWPLFPFGHGLSYTEFEYTNIRSEQRFEGDSWTVAVKCTVRNSGSRKGREIVQLYVEDLEASIDRPLRELKGFSKLELDAGECREVTFSLLPRAFAFFDERNRSWKLEQGSFAIHIGHSSEDLRLHAFITLPETLLPLSG